VSSPSGPGPRLLAPPSGVRDLLPEEARARRALAGQLLALFARHGFAPLVTPAFEHADVLERGLEDQIDPRELLRFVEPETGEVALLRPDLTPQVARIVATRLSDRPGPWRMAYQGTVIRRRQGRSRRSRQLAQAGVECIGLEEPIADPEVVGLATTAMRSVGLGRFRIELGHAALAREALDDVPPAHRDEVARALARKDLGRLERALDDAGVRGAAANRLGRLAALHGGPETLAQARKAFRSDEARRALDATARLVDAVGPRLGDGEALGIDLGELRGVRYYTGVSFTVLAPGPGEPVLAGGRYDGLLGRYGMAAPAVGFAIDLEHVEWALERAGQAPADRNGRPRAVVLAVPPERVSAVADAFRAAGYDVATLPGATVAEAMAYRTGWGYDAALAIDGRGHLHRVAAGGTDDAGAMDDGQDLGADPVAAARALEGWLDDAPADGDGAPASAPDGAAARGR